MIVDIWLYEICINKKNINHLAAKTKEKCRGIKRFIKYIVSIFYKVFTDVKLFSLKNTTNLKATPEIPTPNNNNFVMYLKSRTNNTSSHKC